MSGKTQPATVLNTLTVLVLAGAGVFAVRTCDERGETGEAAEALEPVFPLGDLDTESKPNVFLYVKVPGRGGAFGPGARYEDPLRRFLEEQHLGEVTGGGSSLGSEQFTGIDVYVYEAEKAVPRIVEKLRELGIPKGTVIEQEQPVRRVTEVW